MFRCQDIQMFEQRVPGRPAGAGRRGGGTSRTSAREYRSLSGTSRTPARDQRRFRGGSRILTPAGPTRFSLAFEASGYRWLWLNALCTAMTMTVELLSQGWLILSLTNSPFWVGLAAGVKGASQTLFSIPGGFLADRFDRRRVLLASQSAAALGALVIALLVLTHTIRLWHIFLYLMMAGATNSISKPATSGLVYDVVGARRLLNANAFQFMAGSVVRIIGALVGGVVIDRVGVGQNYFLVAAAYAAGVGTLLMLRNPRVAVRAGEPLLRGVRAGFRYALRTRQIRNLLWLSLVIEAFGFSYSSMLPVMARDVLKVGALGMGYLGAMSGIGQLAATLVVASRGDVRDKGTLMVGAATGFGLFVALFGLSPWFTASLLLVAVVGYLGSTYDATMATVLQTAASPEMRSRVLGLYFSTIGLNQLGGLGIGILATALGTPAALAIAGTVAMAGAAGLLPGLHAFNRPTEPPET